MKDLKRLLGKRIREIRKYKGLTQEQLSEKANLDQRSLSHIECGGAFPSKSLLEISEALNIEHKDLFDFEHLELNCDNMKKYILNNIESLNESDIKTIYRMIKAMK